MDITNRRTAVAALTAAGLLWGTTVPATKLALNWLPPGWLTVARFGLAAAVLLAAVGGRARNAWSPAVAAWGAVGYGGAILVQNAGITRTSVSHAALLIGATPVLVALLAAARERHLGPPAAWTGFAVSFAGVALVAVGGGGGATLPGDALVLASLGVSAAFTVAQARLLQSRDPAAVSAVQFLAAALFALPVAVLAEGPPPPFAGGGPGVALAATAGLALLGTLGANTLFAYGQARVPAETAGAFVNLEPLVGAAAGAVVFGDPVGAAQAAGAVAILAGIALSALPLLAVHARPAPPVHGAARAAVASSRSAPSRAWPTRAWRPSASSSSRAASGRSPAAPPTGPGRERYPPPPMAFHRWASESSAGLSRSRASILTTTAATAPRISRRTTIQVTDGLFLSPSPPVPVWTSHRPCTRPAGGLSRPPARRRRLGRRPPAPAGVDLHPGRRDPTGRPPAHEGQRPRRGQAPQPVAGPPAALAPAGAMEVEERRVGLLGLEGTGPAPRVVARGAAVGEAQRQLEIAEADGAMGAAGFVAAWAGQVRPGPDGQGELQPGGVGAQAGDEHGVGVGAGQQELERDDAGDHGLGWSQPGRDPVARRWLPGRQLEEAHGEGGLVGPQGGRPPGRIQDQPGVQLHPRGRETRS